MSYLRSVRPGFHAMALKYLSEKMNRSLRLPCERLATGIAAMSSRDFREAPVGGMK